MKTPKFRHALAELAQSINRSSLLRAWRKKLGAQLRNQATFDLVDYRDIQSRIDFHVDLLLDDIQSAKYSPQRPIYYLMEKSRGLCRQMTLTHPRDMIFLQALSTALQDELQARAPTDRAFFEPGLGKFDKTKLLLADDAYGAVASWKRFQKKVFGFAKEHEYIVVTDVANFYDFINFRHLRNVIASHCKVKEVTLDFLLFILNELSWNPDYMPRTEIGLPQMELEAPRVLANAMLFELDKVVMDEALGDYARFMDDIDVGVDTIVAAKNVVKNIDLTLQARHLRLNASKTKILSIRKGDAHRHFCIKENYLLDCISKRLESGIFDRATEVRRVHRLYQRWRGAPYGVSLSEKARFFEGNGEKIFKRISTTMGFLKEAIPAEDFIWLVKNRPSIRSFALSRLMHTTKANSTLYSLSAIAQSGLLVDDVSYIEIAKFAVHAKIRDSRKFKSEIRNLIRIARHQNEYFGTYAALVMASKFLETNEILEIIQEKSRNWERDFWLGRLVGGLAPSFVQDAEMKIRYDNIIRDVGNQDALLVHKFHESLLRDAKAAQQQLRYLRSKNSSYPRGIFHAKAMIARSVKQNPAIAPRWSEILQKQPALIEDSYYRRWALL